MAERSLHTGKAAGSIPALPIFFQLALKDRNAGAIMCSAVGVNFLDCYCNQGALYPVAALRRSYAGTHLA